MSEYVGLVEKRSEAARNLLQNMLEKNKITIEEYSEFLEMNQQLSKVLTELLIAGKMFQENQIIKDLSDLFRFYVKPKSEEQCFLEMKQLIEGELGSKNAYVQRVAASIAKSASEALNLPTDIPINEVYKYKIEPLCLPEKVVRLIVKFSNKYEFKKIYDLLSEFNVRDEDMKQIFLIFHTKEIVKNVFNWVAENIRYISDPPDDWFKPALHTLVVGSGDCDDVAILTCSLLRSIGFKTYLGFLPNHVFPGVTLAKIRAVKVGNLPLEIKQKLKDISDVRDDYCIVGTDTVEVPLEQIGTVSFEMNGSDVTLDLFTLAFMGDENLRDLREKISSLKIEYIDRLNELGLSLKTADVKASPINLKEELEKLKANLLKLEKAEECLNSFMRIKAARIYYID